jgi:UPF0042 nucleotide-binding protein
MPGRKTGHKGRARELVVVTGLSGSGKGTVLKSLEDLGYHAVDNLPIELIEKFVEITAAASQSGRVALVIDIREGGGLLRFPAIFRKLKQHANARLVFLEADTPTLVRRFSETRRPHPLGRKGALESSVDAERRRLAPIRKLADHVINTSRFSPGDLKAAVRSAFANADPTGDLALYVTSFSYRAGVPADSDLVFDVRFLPNPNYVPDLKRRTGKDPRVARYVRSFPQTVEFLERVAGLLAFLLPHYIREGKSYLTIAFGCTGGQHRSVFVAEEVGRLLRAGSYPVRLLHRELSRSD